MPRTPTIFFNEKEWKKLKTKVEKEGFPSIYAYMKSLIIDDM